MQPAPFDCPVCGLTFDEQKWAEECEAWCRTHDSCNLAITAHSRERQTAGGCVDTDTNTKLSDRRPL